MQADRSADKKKTSAEAAAGCSHASDVVLRLATLIMALDFGRAASAVRRGRVYQMVARTDEQMDVGNENDGDECRRGSCYAGCKLSERRGDTHDRHIQSGC